MPIVQSRKAEDLAWNERVETPLQGDCVVSDAVPNSAEGLRRKQADSWSRRRRRCRGRGRVGLVVVGEVVVVGVVVVGAVVVVAAIVVVVVVASPVAIVVVVGETVVVGASVVVVVVVVFPVDLPCGFGLAPRPIAIANPAPSIVTNFRRPSRCGPAECGSTLMTDTSADFARSEVFCPGNLSRVRNYTVMWQRCLQPLPPSNGRPTTERVNPAGHVL